MTNQPEVSFTTDREDFALISKIAHRALAMDKDANGRSAATLQTWLMDISACHANGNPLRLRDFLDADDFNFAHDAFGIARKLDRSTGRLTDFFSPRFSDRAACEEFERRANLRAA